MKNKIVRIELSGGIIGMIFTNPRRALDKEVQKQNRDGWECHQIMSNPAPNMFVKILQFVALLLTLFLYTWGAGFLIKLKKSEEIDQKNSNNEDNTQKE